MKKIFILLFAFISMFFIVLKVMPEGSTGSPIYNQQTLGAFDIGSSSVGSSGSVNETYPMGDVSMVYSGESWYLAGYSAIMRSTKEGLPTYNDWNDTFYYGGEELIRITTNPADTTWIYRTKKESNKYITLLSPNTTYTSNWIVYNPDGSKEEYGKIMKGKDDKPRGWLITERYSRGGYDDVRFFYKVASGGEYLLQRIVHKKTGERVYSMTYIDYAMTSTSGHLYQKVDCRYGIEIYKRYYPKIVYNFCGINGPGYSWMNDNEIYNFGGYDYYLTGLYFMEWAMGDIDGLAGEWQLRSVRPCSQDIKLSIQRETNSSSPDYKLIKKAWLVDEGKSTWLNPTNYLYYKYINNDGKIQFATTVDSYNSFGANAPEYLSDINTSLIDIEGDGLVDIVKKINNNTLHVWFNRYDRNTGTINFIYDSVTLNDNNRRLNLDAGLYDWDYDGIADRVVVVQVSATQKDLRVYIGSRTLGGPATITVTYPSSPSFIITNWGKFSQGTTSGDGIIKMPLDLDGNGEPDKVTYVGSNNITVSFQRNGVYSADTPFPNFGSGYLRNYTLSGSYQMDTIYDLMDLNSDGYPDRVNKNNTKLKVRYNLGYQFTSSEYTINSDQNDTNDRLVRVDGTLNNTYVDYIDINGDGYLDRVKKENNQVARVWFNNGYEFNTNGVEITEHTDDYKPILIQNHNDEYRQVTAMYMDMNADGLPDRVLKSGSGQPLKIIYNMISANGAYAGRLKSIIGPNGGSTTYKYQAIDKVNNLVFCKPNMFVVKEKTVWDGMAYSSPMTTTYNYSLAFYLSIDKTVTPYEKVREFRGFHEITEIAPTNDYTKAYYYLDHYKAGLPARITTFNSASTGFSETEFTYYEYTPTQRSIPSIDPRIIYILPKDQKTKIWDGSAVILKRTMSENTYEFNDSLNPGYLSKTKSINYGLVNSSWGDVSDDYVRIEKDLMNDTANPSTIYLTGLDLETKTYKDTSAIVEAAVKNEYYPQTTAPGRLLRAAGKWDGTNYIYSYFLYDSYGNVQRTINPRGVSAYMYYDSVYNAFPTLTSKYDTYSGSTIDFNSENFYDARMRVVKVKTYDIRVGDTYDSETNMYYDNFGRLIAKWLSPDGSWNPNNPGDINKVDEFIEYGNAAFTNQETGAISQPAYTKVRKIQEYNQYNRFWTQVSVDGLGRTIMVKSNPHNSTEASCIVVRTYYNRNKEEIYHNKVETTVPFKSWQSGPDLIDEGSYPVTKTVSYLSSSEGGVSITTNTDGTIVKTTDKNWITNVIDEKLKTTTSYRDGLGKVTEIIDTDGTEIKYFYNSAAGVLLKIEAAGNKRAAPVVTSFTYNKLGQKTNVYDPDMGHLIYTYDNNGNVKTAIDALGNVTVFEYDDLDRLRKQTTTKGSDVDEIINVYDDVTPWDEGYAKGMLVKTTSKSNGTIVSENWFKYDRMQRLIKEKNDIGSQSATMEYEYNAAGQIKKMIYPSVNGNIEQITYQYDQNTGKEQEVRNQDWHRYVYDIKYTPYNKILYMQYANGVKTNYRYNDQGEDGDPWCDALLNYRLNKIDFSCSGTAYLNHWQKYEYDAVGNIEHVYDKDPVFNQDFQYDNLYRMIYAKGIYNASGYTYQYDEIGNMTAKEGILLQYYEPNHVHAVSYANGFGYDYDYDANGNMIKRDASTNSQDRNYTYNNNNMLTRVTDGKGVEKLKAYYHGETRVKLEENGTKTYYFFPQYERKITGSTIEHIKYYFSNGNRIAERKITSGTSGTLNFYHKDHLGSTIRMTDYVGVSKNSTYYKPYGEALVQPGAAIDPDYTYNDKEASDDGDLYYYGARYYDPEKHIIK